MNHGCRVLSPVLRGGMPALLLTPAHCKIPGLDERREKARAIGRVRDENSVE